MKKSLFVAILLMIQSHGTAQIYVPSPENMEARKWFDSARFGMFIHWGVYSYLGAGEWVMNNRNISVGEYQILRDLFNPIDFDAGKWVAAAKSAGMQYLTLVVRHHDGFSMWDTHSSDWKITGTPWAKDPVQLIANECQKQGLKLFLYYSLLDWYRTDYVYEKGRTGKGTGRTEKGDWNQYITFMKSQLTELLTHYGKISGIWFDGYWDLLDNDTDKDRPTKADWHLQDIYPLIHKLQPSCLIGNNHHQTPLPGEDFQMFEKDMPGGNSTGFGGASISSLPLETCETINDSWGFNITDRNFKSDNELIQMLVKTAGYGSNLLLNIGPLPNGAIQQEFTSRLANMGNWLKKYGVTIYGTSGGFKLPGEWGAITQRANKVYIHFFKSPGQKFMIQIPFEVVSAKGYADQRVIPFQNSGKRYYILDLSELGFDEPDTIVELTVNRDN